MGLHLMTRLKQRIVTETMLVILRLGPTDPTESADSDGDDVGDNGLRLMTRLKQRIVMVMAWAIMQTGPNDSANQPMATV